MDGKIEIYRRLRESLDKKNTPNDFIPIELSMEHRLAHKELCNTIGDLVCTKECSVDFPIMFGEESQWLGVLQPFTYLTKSYTTVIKFDKKKFFTVFRESTSVHTI